MCQLLESICIWNGIPKNVDAHQQRMDRSCQHFFGRPASFRLANLLTGLLAKKNPHLSYGRYKLRLLYGNKLDSFSFSPYALPNIRSLKLVVSDTIVYTHKSANREHLNQLFLLRDNQDDILIIKQGVITDISFANVAFYDGERWFTPQNPLLKGIQRAQLLHQKIIQEASISLDDLNCYQKVRLVNAMITWEDALEVLVEDIYQ